MNELLSKKVADLTVGEMTAIRGAIAGMVTPTPDAKLGAVFGYVEPESAPSAAEDQIDELAAFIIAEIPGEPSQNEGAVATAIRLLRATVAASAAKTGN